jgi:catechol 2,3-dioxygenase-like lactoylglutathione lyase family enzyme
MEGFVAHKLNEFETGKISRRRLIETLTLAATTTYAADKAAAADPALKVALVNHISYTCPDFKQAADWYSKVFNLDQIGATNHDVALPFGKKDEKPYNVTANDVPLTHLIIRSRDQNAAPPANATPKPKSTALINHIAYTIADFDQQRVMSELKAMGVQNVRGSANNVNSVHLDDLNGYDVEICGLANNALTDG